MLLETGPGHAIRCIPTPYADVFEAEKRRLRAEAKSPLEVGIALERMNLGRLRVASKGVDRAPTGDGNGTGLSPVPADEQVRRGMYMIGQVAALQELDHDHRRAARRRVPREWRSATTLRREPSCRGAAFPAAVRRGDHRAVVLLPEGDGSVALLGEHPREGQRGNRDPADTLGLAALLRPRPARPRQDGVEVGRVHVGHGVRPAQVRHHAEDRSRTSSRCNCCCSKR